jgi:uncharacterized protein DUF6249
MSDVGLAPAVAVMAFMFAPVAIVYFVLRHRRDVTAMKLKAAADFTERGAAVPFELLLERPKKPGYSDLRIGMVLTCIGVGAVIFAFTLPKHSLWGIGLLPLFAGIGYLITWTLSYRAAASGKDE